MKEYRPDIKLRDLNLENRWVTIRPVGARVERVNIGQNMTVSNGILEIRPIQRPKIESIHTSERKDDPSHRSVVVAARNQKLMPNVYSSDIGSNDFGNLQVRTPKQPRSETHATRYRLREKGRSQLNGGVPRVDGVEQIQSRSQIGKNESEKVHTGGDNL